MRTSVERATGTPRVPVLLGPAFVAAIAYVDPGNVAANLTAGARYGYLLLWVLVAANVMAVLVQYQSAKLGLVTGQSLPGVLGDRLRRGPRLAFWAQAEIVAAATDVAEVVGGAIALHLLFGVPLPVGGLIVGVASMALLVTQDRYGQRRFEGVVVALLAVITVGFLVGLLVSPPDAGGVLGGLVPRFAGADSVLLAASMLGATVMPHAIYVHSALVRDRHGRAPEGSGRRLLLRATRWDVGVALVVAGAVNIGLLLLAAAGLQGTEGTDTIEGAHAAIVSALGPAVGLAFAVGLLASGLASTSVGAYAGATIMEGLLHRRVPLLLRRVVTLIPAIVLLAVGADPTWTLVLSQVVLSFGIPFALVPLVVLGRDRELMGADRNGPWLHAVLCVVVGLVVVLNLALLVLLVV
ncbi:Nramp family divalent metal transporter [Cellulomonas wangsupingiae]|uniref:Nramp family divalent metal transporter n=1 Tax=Cellulomonas wangsupingiae TaxID=2968085 RepID=A0ABY5K5Y6_9CELL|nr:Nramp family divalent metal transporter [Cellulomonas wangsupingiae]MCC2334885.1 Nramp family divalent metal transporter [Cellulomonas wangsupingiae]MCM0638758.1 Nramp family divalent metal transporter [Cellulomonas wangsupingiae]UUI65385.1 Nramp family divalent metal transporter [Cellulomonas wangsupingiae]